MKDTGKVNIHGKEYKTVALRVGEFRAANPLWSIKTKALRIDDDAVVIKASILNEEGRVIATGHCEEYRNQGSINKTAALENCETGAIGRALAAAGYAGSEFASADEIAQKTRASGPPQTNGSAAISEQQVVRFHTIATKNKWTTSEVNQIIKDAGWSSSKQIPKDRFDKLCKALEDPEWHAKITEKVMPEQPPSDVIGDGLDQYGNPLETTLEF